MIYYFSGTGNSSFVGEELRKDLFEPAWFMNLHATNIFEGETLGFVFPVYAWGVPPNVISFIDRLPESFWESVRIGQIYIWIVLVCGDEVAMAPEMIKKVLKKKGVIPESIWSVIMPNNYVLLPGFDVDPKDVEKRKLNEAPARIKEIAEGIKQHRRVIDVTRGSWPRLKTAIVYPLFKKWGISDKKWQSTDGCVSCGICVRSCPNHNIEMIDGRPQWGDNCCSCLACYHSCPRHAVEYGKATLKKGQYFFRHKR